MLTVRARIKRASDFSSAPARRGQFRRCLRKGRGRWFRPSHPLSRDCTPACREAVPRWSRWRRVSTGRAKRVVSSVGSRLAGIGNHVLEVPRLVRPRSKRPAKAITRSRREEFVAVLAPAAASTGLSEPASRSSTCSGCFVRNAGTAKLARRLFVLRSVRPVTVVAGCDSDGRVPRRFAFLANAMILRNTGSSL